MTSPAARPSAGAKGREALGAIRDTTRRILRHPANRARRGRALVLYVTWQVWERVVRRPWTIRLGETRRIRLYPHSVVAAFVLYYRVHDYEDLSFLSAFLRADDLFVDVGANIGVYSLWASEIGGVNVVAFEPSGATYSRLVENIDLNGLRGRVETVRKAVGADPRQVWFTTGQDALNRVADDADGVNGDRETVTQTTLDTELGSRAPALIKIDVEGDEINVLRGGRDSILRHRPVLLVEVNDVKGLTEVLDELGYQAWSYDPERRSLTPTTPSLHANVLAIADVESVRRRLRGAGSAIAEGPPADRTPLPHGLKALLLRGIPSLRMVLLRRDFLRESGWLASGRRGVPVGRDGRPVPWYTYPAFDFLAGRVRPDMSVFEYGAGNSTLWWADRVAHVSAVESDPSWVELLRPRLPDNTDLRFEPDDGVGYAGSALERERTFDILVIDGMDRNACAFACLPALKPDGVVIWDNSDWTTLWADGMAHLEANGFRRIDLRGLGPLVWRPWTTSIFYRPGHNCLGI